VRSRYTQEAAKKFPAVQAPVLLAWSKEDMFFPMKDARRIAELIPNARLEEIDDALTFVSEDQPEALARLIADFIAENPAAAADTAPQRDGAPAG
jgi:pimeloyl-ACP methyl ester carboxylesterase